MSMHKIMLFIQFEFEYLHRKIQFYRTKKFSHKEFGTYLDNS